MLFCPHTGQYAGAYLEWHDINYFILLSSDISPELFFYPYISPFLYTFYRANIFYMQCYVSLKSLSFLRWINNISGYFIPKSRGFTIYHFGFLQDNVKLHDIVQHKTLSLWRIPQMFQNPICILPPQNSQGLLQITWKTYNQWDGVIAESTGGDILTFFFNPWSPKRDCFQDMVPMY